MSVFWLSFNVSVIILINQVWKFSNKKSNDRHLIILDFIAAPICSLILESWCCKPILENQKMMQITVSADYSTHSSHFRASKTTEVCKWGRATSKFVRKQCGRSRAHSLAEQRLHGLVAVAPRAPPARLLRTSLSANQSAALPLRQSARGCSSVDSWSTNCSAGAAVSWRWFFRRISALFRRLVRLQRRWVDFRRPRLPARPVGRRRSPVQLSPRALTGNSACDSLLLFVRFPYFCDHWVDDKWVHCGFELISRSPWGPSAPLSHPDPADRALIGWPERGWVNRTT